MNNELNARIRPIGWHVLVGRTALYVFLCLPIVIYAYNNACARSASFRYKLTLSLNTPNGMKSASSIVELDYQTATFPTAGTPHVVHGQGLYLDLGHGRPPLIAMLTRIRRHEDDNKWFRIWYDDSPAYIFEKHCNFDEMGGQINMVEELHNCRAPIDLTTDELPELVTFSDIRDPNSAKSVNPDRLAETLGDGLSWRSRTLEITEDPVTSDITDHMSIAALRDKFIRLPGVAACCGYVDGIILFELVRK